MEDLEELVNNTPSIELKTTDKCSDLECLMIFGCCGYRITDEGLEVVQPYTEEFDKLIFNKK